MNDATSTDPIAQALAQIAQAGHPLEPDPAAIARATAYADRIGQLGADGTAIVLTDGTTAGQLLDAADLSAPDVGVYAEQIVDALVDREHELAPVAVRAWTEIAGYCDDADAAGLSAFHPLVAMIASELMASLERYAVRGYRGELPISHAQIAIRGIATEAKRERRLLAESLARAEAERRAAAS